jgi:hypothetical protein
MSLNMKLIIKEKDKIALQLDIDINFSCHEYPENNYITVDCYTCGEEGDPLAAINHLIKTLEDLVGVEKQSVKFFKRGEFHDFNTLSMMERSSSVGVSTQEVESIQKKFDSIAKSLTDEQLSNLGDVIDWCGSQKSEEDQFQNEYNSSLHS